MYRHAIEVHPEVGEKCVKATCVLHNFMRRTTQVTAVRGNISVGEVEPLPGLGRLAAKNSAREAIRVREAFTSYFSADSLMTIQRVVHKHTHTFILIKLPIFQYYYVVYQHQNV